MKHLLIILLTLASSSAFASNGSGTMGVAQAALIDSLTSGKVSLIKFDGIDGINVNVLQIDQIRVDGSPNINAIRLPASKIPPAMRLALVNSSENQSWEILESQALPKVESR